MPRPLQKFHDFVGQQLAVSHLRQQIAGARALSEPVPHARFIGPSGSGKTMLARAVAAESGGSLIEASGFNTPNELAAKCAICKAGDILFIDEFHTAPEKAQELLFTIIDEGMLPEWASQAVAADAPACKTTQAAKSNAPKQVSTPAGKKLEPFTIVVATDQPHRLRNALTERITVTIYLRPYSLPEMRAIVDRIASNLQLLLSGQAANMIARAAAGVPRRAKHHLYSLRRHVPDSTVRQIGKEDVVDYLRSAEIDEDGLGPHHRLYLQQLHRAGHASLQSLALAVRMSPDWIREEIEAPLFRLALVSIGSAGRELTPAGRLRVDISSSELNPPETPIASTEMLKK